MNQLKKSYHVVFYYDKSIISFSITYTFQIAFLIYFWDHTKIHTINSSVNMLTVFMSSNVIHLPLIFLYIGFFGLFLMIYSLVIFSRTGYNFIIPVWNTSTTTLETLFWSFVSSTIIFTGFSNIFFYYPSNLLTSLILAIVLSGMSIAILPIFYMKTRYLKIESPETIIMYNQMKKVSFILSLCFIFLIIGALSLVFAYFFSFWWSIIAILLPLIAMKTYNLIIFGNMYIEQIDEAINHVSTALFGK